MVLKKQRFAYRRREMDLVKETTEERSFTDDETPIVEHTRSEISGWERFSFDRIHGVMRWANRALGPSAVYRFGAWFGILEGLVNYKNRRRAREALRKLFPEGVSPRRLNREMREYFIHGRCNKLFYLLLDTFDREWLAARIEFERRDVLDQALRLGRGVYVAMSHHGPYQIGGMFMALRGYKVAAVRDRHEGKLFRYVQRRFDEKFPELQRMKVFFSDASPRALYRCLRQGYILGSAMDVSRVRHERQKTETVSFLGERREFLTGPLRVAIRSGAPVVQAFVLPLGDFRYRAILQGPLWTPDDPFDEEEAVRRAITAYAAHVERHVREHPCHITRI